jgi:hypothetical protein
MWLCDGSVLICQLIDQIQITKKLMEYLLGIYYITLNFFVIEFVLLANHSVVSPRFQLFHV